MALPVVLDDDDDAAIRRAVIVFGLWVAELALGGIGSRSTVLAHPRREAVISESMMQLDVQPAEMETLTRYRAASQRFSFLDHRAANWVFGEEIARVLTRDGDFAITAPAAAWAIHALKAVDEAMPRIGG